MKKFKKVIPALCMLLVSAIMLGSTTYAWFSMNTTVKANNLNVTATSSTTYFIVSETAAGLSGTDNKTEISFSNQTGSVTPISYATAEVGNVSANNWYTAQSTKYNESQGTNPTNATVVTDAFGENSNKYFQKYDIFVGLATNSQAGKFKLNIKTTVADQKTAVKAAVVVTPVGDTENTSAETQCVFTNLSNAGWTTTGAYSLVAGSSTQYVKVSVYVYIDGADNSVTSAAGTISGTINVEINGVPQES